MESMEPETRATRPQRGPRRGLWGLLSAAAALVGIASLAGLFDSHGFVLAFTVHFRAQYAVCLGAACLLFAWGRRWKALLIYAPVLVLNLVAVLPAFLPGPALRNEGPVLRALVANVFTKNEDPAALLGLIRKENPDLIVLLEVNQRWWSALTPLFPSYPHRLEDLREDNFGIAVLSKFPLNDSGVVHFGRGQPPTIITRLATEAGKLYVVATHPASPRDEARLRKNTEQLEAIAEHIRGVEGEVLVLGDLNTTPWASSFRSLLETAELRDSRRGFGNQATWPVGLTGLKLPLDHALVSAGIDVVERRLGPEIGSDHLPLLVSFGLAGELAPH